MIYVSILHKYESGVKLLSADLNLLITHYNKKTFLDSNQQNALK